MHLFLPDGFGGDAEAILREAASVWLAGRTGCTHTITSEGAILRHLEAGEHNLVAKESCATGWGAAFRRDAGRAEHSSGRSFCRQLRGLGDRAGGLKLAKI
ncbi:MAG: hypothetical protein J2P48_04275 [Alphaproteobacteria bacterium]|nr:hypothetical protein [Alphaproteobacteria bacterium]